MDLKLKQNGLLEKLGNQDEDQIHLFNQIEKSLLDLRQVKDELYQKVSAIEVAEGEIYYVIQSYWESEMLPEEIIKKYNYDFWQWATSLSLKGLRPVSQSSIGNKIRVYKEWFSEEKSIFPPPTVYDEDENEIEFQLDEIPYSKLLIATSAGKQGELNEDCWYGLANPEIGIDKLKQSIRFSKVNLNGENESKNGYEIRKGEGGLIYVNDGHFSTPFLRILYENNEQPLFQMAVHNFLQSYSLPIDESDYEEKDSGNNLAITTNQDSIDISLNGNFLSLTLSQAKDLFNLLGGVLDE